MTIVPVPPLLSEIVTDVQYNTTASLFLFPILRKIAEVFMKFICFSVLNSITVIEFVNFSFGFESTEPA